MEGVVEDEVGVGVEGSDQRPYIFVEDFGNVRDKFLMLIIVDKIVPIPGTGEEHT